MKGMLLNEQEIEQICQRIGEEITEKLKDEEKIPVLIGVMKGSLNFMIGMMKYIKVPFIPTISKSLRITEHKEAILLDC